jgi:geranylgeranyl pyrophosphate synthase
MEGIVPLTDPDWTDQNGAVLLDVARAAVDRALVDLVNALAAECPATAEQPIRHAVLAPGKRIRPLLLMAGYRAAGGEDAGIARLACSVELVHAYSLIHDDLPCMDDDVLRRGRPTLHVVYGVEAAVLAGAALMPMAVRAIYSAGDQLGLSDSCLRDLVLELTRAAGGGGMVGGQWLDLKAEGRAVAWPELEDIHRGKTARLITAAVVMGGLAAGADDAMQRRLRRFGLELGLAFQVIDDILDVTGSSSELGKTRGRDVALGKATTPAVLGLDGAVRLGGELADHARGELDGLDRADALLAIADLVIERRS